jgi:hypothetical protein
MTRSGTPDYERCTREMQSVDCGLSFVFHHHFAALKNYSTLTSSKAEACWTSMVETGEVPCVAVVPSTKTSDFAHAAEQLARRPNFKPKALWSDRFPEGVSFWILLYPHILGHLGLFHWLQRIVLTLRQRHKLFHRAVQSLCLCVYQWHPMDLEGVTTALRTGTMNNEGRHSDGAIVELKRSGKFKKRYAELMRKAYHPVNVIQMSLEEWFNNFKVKASAGRPEGLGEIDLRGI